MCEIYCQNGSQKSIEKKLITKKKSYTISGESERWCELRFYNFEFDLRESTVI